jgi:hypothetical protein
MLSLEIVGNIKVSDKIYSSLRYHYMCQRLNRVKGPVVGTENSKIVEIYGWKPNVGKHIDNTGFVYVLPLHSDGLLISEDSSVNIIKGDVICLNDHIAHYTTNKNTVVALFVGSYSSRQDELALNKFRNFMKRIDISEDRLKPFSIKTSGYTRILSNCVMLENEYVPYKIIYKEHAKDKGIKCSACDNTAITIDKHHPYLQDHTLCQKHLIIR